MFSFEYPINFSLLILVPITYFYSLKKNPFIRLNHSIFGSINFLKTNIIIKIINFIIKLFFLLSLISLIIASTRPMIINKKEINLNDGMNIMIVVDLSPTMAALDSNNKTHLELAKETIKYFISKRKNDSIGLLGFAKETFLYSALTQDYHYLSDRLSDLNILDLGDGSALGLGLASALYHMKDFENEKVILLLTDGINNLEKVPYKEAIYLANELNIKIYTIAIISNKEVLKIKFKKNDKEYIGNLNNFYNENILKEIAQRTKGKYFKAYEKNILENIFSFIDSKETSKRYIKIETDKLYIYDFFIDLSIIFFFIAFFLKEIILKSIL